MKKDNFKLSLDRECGCGVLNLKFSIPVLQQKGIRKCEYCKHTCLTINYLKIYIDNYKNLYSYQKMCCLCFIKYDDRHNRICILCSLRGDER